MPVRVNVQNNTNMPITVGFFNGPEDGCMTVKDVPPKGSKPGNFQMENARVVCAWTAANAFLMPPTAAFMEPPYDPDKTYQVVVNNGSIDIN